MAGLEGRDDRLRARDRVGDRGGDGRIDADRIGACVANAVGVLRDSIAPDIGHRLADSEDRCHLSSNHAAMISGDAAEIDRLRAVCLCAPQEHPDVGAAVGIEVEDGDHAPAIFLEPGREGRRERLPIGLMVGEHCHATQLQVLVGEVRGSGSLELVGRREAKEIVGARRPELGGGGEPCGTAAHRRAAGAELGRQIWLLGEAAAAHGRAHQGEVRNVGDRNGLARDAGVEWADYAENERVRGKRLDVAGSFRRIVGTVDGVVASVDLNAESIHRRVPVDEELHAIEHGRARPPRRTGQGQVHADLDDLGRRPKRAGPHGYQRRHHRNR